MRGIGALFAVSLLMAPCAAAAAAAADSQVIRAALDHWCHQPGANIVLDEQPLVPSHDLRGYAPGLDARALSDLVARSQASKILPPVPACPGVRMVAHERLAHALERRPGKRSPLPASPGAGVPIAAGTGFMDEFPAATGLARVSRPGYSAAGDVAIVYVTIACGGFCGHGAYMVLRLMDGRWSVQTTRRVWLSRAGALLPPAKVPG